MNEEIGQIVRDHADEGEYLLGFSDLWGIVEGEFSDLIYGITVGLKLDDRVVDEVIDGPTEAYLAHYGEINRRLDDLTAEIVSYLESAGARAEAIPATIYRDPSNPNDPYYATLAASFPHKTAATRAGLGWVGKTALFISDRFGPRVRLATVLTDRPLETGVPCEMSLCGDCLCCVEECPAGAADGMEWFPGLEREVFFNASRCRRKCLELAKAATGRDDTAVCGICMAVCPVGIEFRTPESADEWI